MTIHGGGHTYHVPRGWLVAVDAQATATHVLAAGSMGSLVVAKRTDVAPVVKRAAVAGNVLAEIARAGRSAVPASVRVDGWQAVMTPARIGLRLDRTALLQRLIERDRVIEAPFAHVQPTIKTTAARSAAATIDALLSAPVAIDYHGAHRGTLTRTQLAHALSVHPDGHRFAVSLDGDQLARLVRPRLGKWIVRAHNAQFVVAGKSRTRDAVASRPRRRPCAACRGGAAGDRRRSRRAHRARPAAAGPHDGGREGARHPAEARLVHDADGRVVVEPHPQRASDGRLHRRHDHRAGRGVLVQRRRRAAHVGARVPRGADDHRLARPPVDRRRRVPDGDDALQRRVRARPADPRSARTTTSISRITRSDATRRSRGAARTSSSGTT